MGRATQAGKVHHGFVTVASWLDSLADRFLWAAKGLLAVSVGVAIYYAADRAPPFAVLSVEPAEALPGQSITIYASVRRDVARNCSADMSRYIFDASGTRFDLGTSFFTAEVIRAMEKHSPGRLTIAINVPASAKPGPANMTSVLLYRCNRVHNLYPIEVTASFPFRVLSPSLD
jgi:hypothetical protein